ncbi:23S rRNA (uracil(1939)-C(5))-methyltransferase RlmD [Candidatus Arthromitus sp. SFB-rat-Yit]|uniref:23S rRNA (uracil(1939)-C(5))-methyltransferase RlmD n=1 Tax=Candidatus Arthromitus sp. SFB-rat-Yit TaxID=1041504 RepID=UPI000227A4F4|nr:23S rRNA (uracil(1939)-C(5))-methyltransferase RlmD [Candidatus Arthromitus sp. SFB-rat-Yit]BAK81573.1 23S rRNA (uracil-5-)-methyltransferase RumA [Candidatus Arthromitus sp. SFB-rat-Yit]
MKKGEIFELDIIGFDFKGEGYGEIDGERYFVKGAIPYEKLKVRFVKSKGGRKICKRVGILNKSHIEISPSCDKFGECGGCTYLNISYEDQIKLKEEALRDLLNEINYDSFLGILKSPKEFEYRNKMEFSFGDEFRGGPLELGLHKKGNPFGVVPTYNCKLISEDFRKIMRSTVEYFREIGAEPYKLKTHKGYLRNLVLREGKEEILLSIVTSSQNDMDFREFKDRILSLNLKKSIGGIVHIVSDSLSDAVNPSKIEIIYGNDFVYEEIFELKFKINTFSFFQTNTEGVKVLYNEVKNRVGNPNGTILDLYSGVGTIGQVLSKNNKVIGVEIVEDAVKMAKENAKLNNLCCEFICGDVSQVVKDIKDKISFIVVDPPRAGIGAKGVKNICKFDVENIVYVSCNPQTLRDDLKEFLNNGYKVNNIQAVDMFPNTYHVETVVLMSRVEK